MTTGRFDLYGPIHKAIRMVMGETLTNLGRADASDPASVAPVLEQVRWMLDMCVLHVEDENAFIHAAIAARAPQWEAETVADHEHHLTAIDSLRATADAVDAAPAALRAVALTRLYRAFAVFVGENFLHMEVEESANNSALWAHYSDVELMAIHDALVASLPPEAAAAGMRFLLLAATPAERAATLRAIRETAPESVFDGLLEAIRSGLSPLDRQKLAVALGGFAVAA